MYGLRSYLKVDFRLEWNFSVVMDDLKASYFRLVCSGWQAEQEAEFRFEENMFFCLGTVGLVFLSILSTLLLGFCFALSAGFNTLPI